MITKNIAGVEENIERVRLIREKISAITAIIGLITAVVALLTNFISIKIIAVIIFLVILAVAIGFITHRIREWIQSVISLLFSIVLLLAIPGVVLYSYLALPVDNSRYGFESGTMGWAHETWEDSQGVTAVAQSREQAKLGKHSFKLTVDLEGGHPNRSKGEAYVEIPPQNLENKQITVWVYVPRMALGDPRIPNGIQVFVKDNDKNWRGEYGTWWAITAARVDSWQQVTLTPSRVAPPDGYMAPGFDPTQIRAVGVKVAIGEGAEAMYEGPIYVDTVNW